MGFLTSVARHHEDGPIALALIKRNTPVDAVLVAGDVAGAQTVVVTPDPLEPPLVAVSAASDASSVAVVRRSPQQVGGLGS